MAKDQLEAALRIRYQLATMVREARAANLDALTYLLSMAHMQAEEDVIKRGGRADAPRI